MAGVSYLPSPRTIRERCLEIQAGWSVHTEAVRRGAIVDGRDQSGKWNPPIVSFRQLSEAYQDLRDAKRRSI